VESLWRYQGVDWVGIIFSMLSTYYLGKKRKRGFLLGIVGNLAFVAFGFMAGSLANVAANGTYLFLNARGWWKWKEEPPKKEEAKGDKESSSDKADCTEA
jgi:nicotinamide riboside transporter PnuC